MQPALPLSIMLLLAACAPSPDRIEPATLSANPYGRVDCPGLAGPLRQHSQNLAVMSLAQEDAASGDAMGMFLIGLPLASMAGKDQAPAIAEAKGHITLIKAEQQRKSCPD